MLSPERITVELSNKEALVLFDFLARLNRLPVPLPGLFDDQAEQRVLWDVECLLEKQLDELFSPTYARRSRNSGSSRQSAVAAS